MLQWTKQYLLHRNIIEGNSLTDQNGGNWGATKDGDYYIKPTGNDQKIAEYVDYNGVSLKIYIWMEGTDSDCVNMNGLDKGTENPTFDVTVSFVGVVFFYPNIPILSTIPTHPTLFQYIY